MRKKSGLIILVLVIVLQLCVPAGMIIYRTTETNTIIENGELFRFEIHNMTYINGELTIDILTYDDWGKQYAQIQTDNSVYAELLLTETKPQGDIYIKSSEKLEFDFPVETIKTEEYENLDYIFMSKRTGEEDWWDKILENHKLYKRAYLEAYVYKGKIAPVAVYIDGTEVNVYLSRLNEDKQ